MCWSLQVPEELKSLVLKMWASWKNFEKTRNLTPRVLFHSCPCECHCAALGWITGHPRVPHGCTTARGKDCSSPLGQGCQRQWEPRLALCSYLMNPTKIIIWYSFCPQSLARGWFLFSGYQHFDSQRVNLQEGSDRPYLCSLEALIFKPVSLYINEHHYLVYVLSKI